MVTSRNKLATPRTEDNTGDPAHICVDHSHQLADTARPQAASTVSRSSNQTASGRAETERVDRQAVSAQGGDCTANGRVPEFNLAVDAGRGEVGAVGRKADRAHGGGVAA